jgi:hypothetical protein
LAIQNWVAAATKGEVVVHSANHNLQVGLEGIVSKRLGSRYRAHATMGSPAIKTRMLEIGVIGAAAGARPDHPISGRRRVRPKNISHFTSLSGDAGGEGGIRTPDTVARIPHFECGAIDHSATSPWSQGPTSPVGGPLCIQRRRPKQGRGANRDRRADRGNGGARPLDLLGPMARQVHCASFIVRPALR